MSNPVERRELIYVIEIVIAPEDRRDELWTLFQEYCDELSSFDGEKRPHSPRHYPYFDLYWQESKRFPFLLLSDHEPAGFCLMRDTGLCYEIAEFYIRPLYRRRGLGKLLVDFVKNFCREHGRHDTLAANVYVNNEPAVRFWLSAGFRDTGRRTRIKDLRMIETEASLVEAGQ